MFDRSKIPVLRFWRLFWQFVKYGAIGSVATLIQLVTFYLMAATVLRCLRADDPMVVHLGLPAMAEASETLRTAYFLVDTAVGFTVANVFCWVMNRTFVFKPGRFHWAAELGMFFMVSGGAVLVGMLVGALAIKWLGLATTTAVVFEVLSSLLLNFFMRKFFIFRR